MQNRNDDERTGRESESALTTEDLTGPEPNGRGGPAVYPGEATAGRSAAAQPPSDPPATTGSPERAGDELWQEEEGQQDVAPAPLASGDPDEQDDPLLRAGEAESYRNRWNEIQGRFVDDPREAVRSADSLVAEVMQTFADRLSEHRSGLEKQWDRGEQVPTEDLRQALRAYRSLANRLLDT